MTTTTPRQQATIVLDDETKELSVELERAVNNIDKIFARYCRQHKPPLILEFTDPNQLDRVVSNFAAVVRNSRGERFSASSLETLVQSLIPKVNPQWQLSMSEFSNTRNVLNDAMAREKEYEEKPKFSKFTE